jgi:Mu-like prophage I protein
MTSRHVRGFKLAKVGSWTSNRYGPFAIEKQDLSQIDYNHKNITPKAPTELPIDFDHLSMDPKKPGDGVAAGWLKATELRADGEELWGLVEWTSDEAELIRKGAYRFVSPSFVKDHVHKNGEKIGTTLLAAAITNHPFLEGMKALTLFNFSAMGDLAVAESAPGRATERALHLAEIDQVVSFSDDPELTPELTPEDRAQGPFKVTARVGEGDDQFVRVVTMDGKDFFGWFRANQLAPAPAPNKEKESPMPAKTVKLTADEELDALAKEISRQTGKPYKLSLLEAANQRHDLTDARRTEIGAPVAEEPAADAEPVVNNPFNLRALPGERFSQIVSRVSREQGIGFREATRIASDAFPALAEKWSSGEAL